MKIAKTQAVISLLALLLWWPFPLPLPSGGGPVGDPGTTESNSGGGTGGGSGSPCTWGSPKCTPPP